MPYVIPYQKNAFGREMLEKIIVWVSANLSVDQVFTDDQIYEWLASNADDDIWQRLLDLVAVRELPEDVFLSATLERWADQHYAHGQK